VTKKEIKVGKHYVAKVSGKLTVVSIVRESRLGGWDAINVTTRKPVRIKTARSLRLEVEPSDSDGFLWRRVRKEAA
jgi:predicted dinucleotide-utilizing enzyme